MAAKGRTVVKRRSDPETGEPLSVHIPDHIDVLAEYAIGAQARFTISTVLGECKL